ncbi:MAG: hypothetical protein SGJ19_09485 [Planctomycetia bacterium]|nr:hypothetical protein [Planctomycetia bacterium]
MPPSQPRNSLRLAAAWQELRPSWPSWCISSVLHAALLIAAYLLVSGTTPQGIEEPGRGVGIVLTPRRSAHEGSSTSVADDESAGSASVETPLSGVISERPPIDPRELLPAARGAIGTDTAANASTSAAGMERGSGRLGSFGADGARTEVFGLTAVGNRFAYVFDRSGSMGGPGENLLQAAKAELLRSLDRLGDLQQFQIIFYNEAPTMMQLAAQPGRLVLATDDNKSLARDFLGRITAGGATRHEEALAAALRMHPDVIFFLTDADEPALTKDQLLRISRLNDDRTTIHTIEFGHGPKVGGEQNFIVLLAGQNGGEYQYVDVTRLGE